jgi:metal-dependent amidase/aminoacylase/carboxypeptidase family protein
MAVRLIKTAVKENQFELMEKTILYLGEDFGLFTQHYPGAMFGLGSGTDSPAYTILTTIFRRYYYDWVSIFTT